MTFKIGQEVDRSEQFPRHGLADAFQWAVAVTHSDSGIAAMPRHPETS